MIGALFTTLCFAITAICAQRAAQLVGSTQANAARLAIAVLVLGAWAHGWGLGLGGRALGWFFISGLVGFGVGGWAMFQSLPRLGASLAMLIVQCGSVLVAALGEWSWLGQKLTFLQWMGIALTILGLLMGLAPRTWPHLSAASWTAGLIWALLSALGQGCGAVLSRKAFAVARVAKETVDPGTAAYQRAVAGLLFGLLMWGAAALMQRWRKDRLKPKSTGPDERRSDTISRSGRDDALASGGPWRTASPWIAANALTGPILGVVFFQWALRSLPAGIVQSVVATSPLATIPLAAWIEGRWPMRRYYLGAVLAVAGIVLHSLAHS